MHRLLSHEILSRSNRIMLLSCSVKSKLVVIERSDKECIP